VQAFGSTNDSSQSQRIVPEDDLTADASQFAEPDHGKV
jgi:hypothetical protein